MRRSEGIAYLMKDGDLRVFGRYGPTASDAAAVAWRLAYLIAREIGEEIETEDLDYAMFLVVNEHDDVKTIINNYGRGKYR